MPGRRRIIPVAVDNPLSSRPLFTLPCRVHGYAVRETTNAAGAAFTLHNGAGTPNVGAFPITLAANESVRDWFGEAGIWFEDGIFFELVSGTISGSVFLSELAADLYAETDIGSAIRHFEG